MNKIKKPGWILLTLGVIYPVVVIVIELINEWCAEAFFDPMPSIWHVILVAAVPLSNLLLWWRLRNFSLHRYKALSFLSAVSIGIAASYAIIFLPLTPLGVVAIVFYGIGLLPLAPLVSLIVAIVLYRRLRGAILGHEQKTVAVWKGIAASVLALVLLDIPSIAANQGIVWAASDTAEVRQRGVRLLRTLGDEEILLRRCYDQSGRASGPLGIAMNFFGHNNRYVSTLKVREIFFRVTGEPFNSYPPPYTGGRWRLMSDFEFDSDQGGTEVGGRVKGLHLTSSRIDGSVSGDDGIAYLEWTLEFRNDSPLQREVRLNMVLPPNGVASRATLWVNGEEREAAFAGRAATTQAYQSVVRRQRDPLLVTTKGTDRLQAQAFPLAPNGGTIKFRIGITAPLELATESEARLVLPAIVDRNFVIGNSVKHSLWIEGQQALQTTLVDAITEEVAASTYRITASINDVSLSHIRPTVITARDRSATKRWARLDPETTVVQNIVRQSSQPADALMIVLDGSGRTSDHIGDIVAALQHIPSRTRVGMVIAGEPDRVLPIDEWTAAQQQSLTRMISSYDFAGGQDNAPALTTAFRELERYANADLLWIHLPQPIDFSGSTASLLQTMTRLSRLPNTALYSLEPGPNALLSKGNWELHSRTIPRTRASKDDLADYFRRSLSLAPSYRFDRRAVTNVDAIPQGSEHIARLWARDQIHELLTSNPTEGQSRGIEIAATYQLVTAVSGAVVLENAGQYEDNNLNPVSANSVPTIPEPEQWVLALIVFAMMLWIVRRNRYPQPVASL